MFSSPYRSSLSTVDAYEDASAGPSTVCYSRSESRSESKSPAPSTAHAHRKGALEKKKNGLRRSTRIYDELRNVKQQTGNEFDVFGVFLATTLRKIAGCDRRLADLTQLELTEHLNKKSEALTNMPF